MGKFLRLSMVGVATFLALNLSAFAQYRSHIYGPINVDDGSAVSGISASTAISTTNGSIRYQWRVIPTTAGDNRWLGFEWNSLARQFAFYGNPTFTASDNVQISDKMDVGGSAYGWGAIGNFRINGVETGKRLIFNIVDDGTTLTTAPGNDQTQFALTEINHSAALATVNDNTTSGMAVARSGNTLTLSMTNTAENSGSNEEIWWQWSHDNWTTKNFIEDTAIAANETTTINLSSSAPILREGDTLRFIAGTFGPIDLSTISATYSNSLGFDIAAINKSRVVMHVVTDDDTTAPVFTGFSVAGKTDAEILAGGWSLSGNIQDTGSGVNENGVTVTGDDFSPNYDLVNAAATAVVDNRPFATRPADGGAQGSPATLADPVPAVAAASIDLGTYTVRASATDNDGDPSTSANDRTPVINSTIATFTVTDDDSAAPVPSAFSVAAQTDGQIVAGGYTISGTLTDAGSGINNNGATVTGNDFSPNFDILNNANTELVGNQVFTTRPADGANGTASAAAPAIAAGTSIDLGTYKITVSVTDNDEDRTAVNDRTALVNSQVTTFTVTDDDTSGPVHSGFTGNSITLSGANYLDTDLASGLAIAGSVQDAQSGVSAGSSSRYGLARDGVGAASGSFNTLFTDGQGVGSPVSVSITIPKAIVEVVGTYVLYVTNFNYDVDRGTADRESTVDTYTFTVYANNPVITVQAGTLAFGSLVVNGTSAEQSYNVSGINLGSDPIVITAPSGFQVSTTSGSGFGSSLNLTPSGGTVGNTTIYVRFVPNNVASFSANITHTHTSAPTQNKAVTGTGIPAPAIGRGPSSLTFETMVGSSPASQSFYVTNVGGSTLTYNATVSYGSGSGWLTPSPSSGNLAANASQTHSANINVNTMAAGAYNATITLNGNQTNPAQTVTVSLTITNIPVVNSFSATADGNQMVRLTTSDSSGRQVLIAYRSGSDLSANPVNGTAYSVGSSLGSGTVIYKGAPGSFEHVVAAGATHYYRAYVINNDHYSAPDSKNASTGSYGASERVETFSYTNAVPLNGVNGGNGWSGAWSLSVPNANVDAVIDNANFSTFQSAWPLETGNRLVLKTTNSATYAAFRDMPAVNSGKIYIAALYRREFNEGNTDGKFSGISFFNGGSEVGFVGERGASGNDDIFGTTAGGVGATYGSANSFGAGVDRLIIACYDFSDGSMKGIYYNSGDTVPSSEPTYFVTAATTPAAQINRIRVAAGATSGWNGQVHFDEIRVATSWKALLNIPAPDVPVAFTATGGALQNTLNFTRNAALNPVVIVYNATGVFTEPSGTPPSIGQSFAGGTLLYNGGTSPQTHSSLSAGETVYYKAFSYDSAGPAYSDGLTANATTIPPAPTTASASSIGYTSFTANWNTSAGATSYRLDVSPYSDFSQMVPGYDNLTVGGTSQAVSIPGTDNKIGMYYYRVRAVNTAGTSGNSDTRMVGTSIPQAVNGGGTPPAATIVAPSTIYVGDNGTFAVKAWATLSGNFAQHRVVIDTDSNIMAGGIRGAWSGFDDVLYSSETSPRFTSAGTWYWGMQFDYGAPYGSNVWMVTDRPNWADMYYAGTNVNLTVTVTALSDPTGVSAVKDGTLPAEKINLAWTKWNSKDVLVVRSLDNNFTAPTPGQAYTAGNSIGDDTVVYKGAGTSFADTGLSASTTYHYKYYSENFSYYSDGATASETTDASPAPDTPVATAASGVGYATFTANWNASAGATSYRIDVSRNAAFTELVISDHNPGNVTSYAVSGFGTGFYYYRVRAVNAGGTSDNSNVIEIGTLTAQARNTGGGGSPQVTASLYLGDTATFGLDSDANLSGNWGQARVWVHTTASVGSGTPTAWGGFVNQVNRTVNRQMTSAGTFYWAIQIDYGAPYATNFWYTKSSSGYTPMHYAPTGVTLQVTVSALGDPTGLGTTVVGQNQINLSWTKWLGRDVMVVRSTDASFGTPAPGNVYSAGNTIAGDLVVYKGSGTSFNDTGLSQSTTYYYKFYSENYGYYSAGVTASAATEGDVPVAPTAYAATTVQPTSFQANWSASAGATSYRLDVSTVNNFASFVGSYNNLNVLNVTTYSVSGLTGGQTYYFRVRAFNGAGASLNSGTITVVTPASATVAIQSIDSTGPNTGNLNFTATVGATYDLFYSDNSGSNWLPLTPPSVTAQNATETVAVNETSHRLFKVVIAGANVTSSPSTPHAVVERTVPVGYSMMSAPVAYGNLSLSGTFGDELKDGLANGSKLYFMESDGSMTTITLSGGSWTPNYTPDEGQGFFVENQGGSYVPRFAGPVGNTGAATLTINGDAGAGGRWNIIGLSQGKTRTFAQTFPNGNSPTVYSTPPTANWNQNSADVIAIETSPGVFRRVFRAGDGTWRDATTLAAPNFNFAPGAAVYYQRRGSDMTITF